jgi:hypothetical protein
MARAKGKVKSEDPVERDRREYQRQYYLDKKERISQERKQRYQEDAEYRAAILERVKEYRTELRSKRSKLRNEGKIPPPHPRGPRQPMKVIVNGVSTVAYTVGRLAEEINRSKDVINYWSRIGLLPKTPYRSSRGDRLYTECMTIVLKLAIWKRGRVSVSDRTFTDEVRRGWEGLGVVIPVDKQIISR